MKLLKIDEEALGKYTEWLNEWNRHWDGDDATLIDRSSYDAEYAAPLKVTSRNVNRHLMLTLISCDPFQDEGGPHELITIHRRLDYDDDWTLGCIIQHFDTLFTTVFENERLTYNGKDKPE
jgi:hypothetical protein